MVGMRENGHEYRKLDVAGLKSTPEVLEVAGLVNCAFMRRHRKTTATVVQTVAYR